MSTRTNDSNFNASSPTGATFTPPLTNSPPTDPDPNVPPISTSNNANDIDLAATMDTNHRDNTAASSTGPSGIDGIEEINDEGPTPPVTMTEAAAIIVAKQRRGAPGVEHDGIHDTAPTPYAEAPDVDDEPGKSLGNTSRNNRVHHDVEDGGARPFDSDKFEDIEEGKEEEKEEIYNNEDQEDDNAQDSDEEEEEVNVERPRNEVVVLPTRAPPRSMLPNNNHRRSLIELEATLVPNEPVYDLEPVPAWYMEEKARRFIAFVSFMFIAAVVVISALFTRIPSAVTTTEVVTVEKEVLFWASVAPSMSLSTIPSDAPSSLPSSSPTNTCFNNKDELKSAISSYITQDCAQNENCNTARVYGYPMNSWCVGQLTDMSWLFRDMRTFNEDISEWDVSSVTSMYRMFYNAAAFNSDVSEWDVSSVTNMDDMFRLAAAFNSDVSEWDVSSVTIMDDMFYYAAAFNSDVSEWDVSSVASMYDMFGNAAAFNQDLCAWGDKFPYNQARDMFILSGCTFQDAPNEQQGGPFCASTCSE